MIRHLSTAFLLCALISLPACGIADHYEAQGRMEKSQDAYRACLVTNSGDESKCTTLKSIYDEDKARYDK